MWRKIIHQSKGIIIEIHSVIVYDSTEQMQRLDIRR